MEEIRHHVHVYLLLVAASILGLGGMLSLWRMHEIEREYHAWSTNQTVIITTLRTMIAADDRIVADIAAMLADQNQRFKRIETRQEKILAHIEREEARWKDH